MGDLGFGDILGSISPAYGMISGNGLGGLMRYLNPPFAISQMIGGHDNKSAPAAPPVIPGLDPGPLTTNAPSLATLANDVPTVPKADPTTSPLFAMGQSLLHQPKDAPQAPALNVPQAQAMPFNDSMVQQLLATIGQNYLGRLGG
jgi:hypothetical protein